MEPLLRTRIIITRNHLSITDSIAVAIPRLILLILILLIHLHLALRPLQIPLSRCHRPRILRIRHRPRRMPRQDTTRIGRRGLGSRARRVETLLLRGARAALVRALGRRLRRRSSRPSSSSCSCSAAATVAGSTAAVAVTIASGGGGVREAVVPGAAGAGHGDVGRERSGDGGGGLGLAAAAGDDGSWACGFEVVDGGGRAGIWGNWGVFALEGGGGCGAVRVEVRVDDEGAADVAFFDCGLAVLVFVGVFDTGSCFCDRAASHVRHRS
ncbi:hypothetical protein EV356DRAFT_165911 [Viridothelium virens]|uniref:Uncharacterized protein n=1 Tax=Viridothelium virens TaxID=1048519 RepID=A0A6A6HNR5_VIRVR|nr:hypothetical protein EV356DRAFT_165911 [Viridothelium virens]